MTHWAGVKGWCWRAVSRPSRQLELLAGLLVLLSLGSLLYILYHRRLLTRADLTPLDSPPWGPLPPEQRAGPPQWGAALPGQKALPPGQGAGRGGGVPKVSSGVSEPRIPVYVVEEHHEVLKYWFNAAERGIVPKHGNVLFHIDGHSDAATPANNSILPLFRWPRDYSEVRAMMQGNDVFIVAASIAGLLGRYIWVWPPWDSVSISDHQLDYMAFDMGLGIAYRNISTETRVREICFCVTIRHHPGEKECTTTNSSSNDPDDDSFTIDPRDCTEQARGLMEVVSESKAVQLVEQGGWLSPTDSIILDIDEDFYGCEAASTPLDEAGVHQMTLIMLGVWVSRLACISSTAEERQLDSLFYDLLQKLVQYKRLCSQGLLPAPLCSGSPLALLNSTSLVEDTLAQLSARGLSHCQPPDTHRGAVIHIITSLWKMDVKQLQALAQVGVCLNMSPKGSRFQREQSVKICDGYNHPNASAVPFHTPSLEEVAERTRQLGWLLNWGPVRPRLVTVCRSVRDGYTPRALFRRIEDDVLHALARAFRGVRPDTVTYDPDLLGGPLGWYSRH